MPSQDKAQRGIHDVFLIGVALKGLDGFIELVLGCALLFTDEYTDVVSFFTNNDLVDTPNDLLATELSKLANLSHAAVAFAGIYLLAHGIVKLFIAGSLLKNYAWAYPVGAALLFILIAYEVVRIVQTGSLVLMGLTLFDVILLGLVGYEYTRWPHRA